MKKDEVVCVYLLEFPQNIIGYTLFKIYTRIYNHPFYKYQDAYVTHVKGRWGAISLSRFIFADDRWFQSEMIKHEYGHTIQSKRLLLLYIPIIGIPSLVWNKFFRKYRIRKQRSYYSFYTESWANKLGGFEERV